MGKLREKLLCRSRRRISSSGEKATLHYHASIQSPAGHSSEEAQPARHLVRKGDSKDLQAADAAILDLPTEISEMVFDLLDFVSTIRLRQTCRALYYHGLALDSLLYQLSSNKDPSTTFARLCFAERSHTNKPGSPGKLLCGGCRIYHSTGSFSTENIGKQAEERMCFGQQGRLYFTPEHSISFMELTTKVNKTAHLRYLLMDTRKKTTYGHCPTTAISRRTPYIISPLYQQCSSVYGHSFDYFWRFDVEGVDDQVDSIGLLKTELSGTVINLCPHVKSNDTKVITAVHECQSKHIYMHKEAPQIKCHKCKMHACVMLQSEDPWAPQQESRHRVIVHVARYVGNLGCNISNWWRCTCQLDDRGAMQAQWLMQVDVPKVRIIHGLKKVDVPFITFRPSNGSFRFHDRDFGLEWGQCPQW